MEISNGESKTSNDQNTPFMGSPAISNASVDRSHKQNIPFTDVFAIAIQALKWTDRALKFARRPHASFNSLLKGSIKELKDTGTAVKMTDTTWKASGTAWKKYTPAMD